jgi:hypothetical protein
MGNRPSRSRSTAAAPRGGREQGGGELSAASRVEQLHRSATTWISREGGTGGGNRSFLTHGGAVEVGENRSFLARGRGRAPNDVGEESVRAVSGELAAGELGGSQRRWGGDGRRLWRRQGPGGKHNKRNIIFHLSMAVSHQLHI